MEEQLSSDHQRGNTADAGGNQPGHQQQPQAGGGQQAAAQVVEDLPAVQQGQRIAAASARGLGDTRKNPPGDLPVAANPAMGAAAVTLVPLGKFVVKLDIAGQPHPHMCPFDQVMAQHPLFGETAGKHAAEGSYVVDALAMVRSFAAQILIDIGDSLGIGVDADRIGEEPAENRDTGAGQGRAYPRLDDGVTGHDIARAIEAWLIQRMRQCLDHPAGRCVRQLGVAVQRDDEAHIGKMIRVAHINQAWGILRPRSVDLAVQLLQLAPFALPADEFPLGFAPGALTMEQEKTFAFVAPVELGQAFARYLQQVAVVVTGKRE